MRASQKVLFAALAVVGLANPAAQAGGHVVVGVGIGVPGPFYYRPYPYYYRPYYYAPYPAVYVAPQPVYVAPAGAASGLSPAGRLPGSAGLCSGAGSATTAVAVHSGAPTRDADFPSSNPDIAAGAPTGAGTVVLTHDYKHARPAPLDGAGRVAFDVAKPIIPGWNPKRTPTR